MKQSSTCNRSWQAEATYDRRLQGPDRDAFLRHAAQCAECSSELAALSRLRELGASFETRHYTELEHRRLRQSLLRRADELMVGGVELGNAARWMSPARLRWAGAIAVLACALGVTLWIVRRNDAPAVTTFTVAAPDAAPRFEIQATEGGRSYVKQDGPSLVVGVTKGTYAVHVQKLTPTQRFVMHLPDGDLEVHGTRFVLVVGTTSTRSVTVSEGLVALRITGQHELRLHPGDSWSTPTPPATPTPPDVARSAKPPETSPAAARPSSVSKAPKPDAGAAFTHAMSAYSRGDFAEAERSFLAFERDFPSDARTEDSAFLRATARARRGDAQGARALAQDYLRRFPFGLRRVEAERLSR
jgi:hypothetical protein